MSYPQRSENLCTVCGKSQSDHITRQWSKNGGWHNFKSKRK